MMDARQTLFYGLGQMAFAVAIADGKIQREEADKLHEIVEAEIKQHEIDFDISEIIFLVMERGHQGPETAYEWAMKDINLGSQYLTPELREVFVSIVEKVAEAFAGTNAAERELVDRFRAELAAVK